MRPQLHRGQASAKGILHTEQRTPVQHGVAADGKPTLTEGDPRGYWAPHSASAEKRARRALVAHYGRRQFLKLNKERRRG